MRRFPLFVSACALVAALFIGLAAPDASAKDEVTRGLRYPSISPDGKLVTFAYRGDIWVAETGSKDGRITRLTIHEAQDTLPRFSPDGKSIAFSSVRHGGYDLYTISVKGGVPKRITHHSGTEILWGWSPDGKKLCFGSDRDPTVRGLDVYEVAVAGGPVIRLTDDGNAREASYSADGKHLVFVKGTNTIYQDNYEGSGNHDIWIAPVKQPGQPVPLAKRLTKTDGNERYPAFSKDAKTIWFIAEEKGVANYYAMPADGGARTQVTKYTGNDIHRPCLGHDFKTSAFEVHGQLFTADLSTKDAPRKRIDLVVRSDVRHSGVVRHQITNGVQQVHLNASGSQIVCTVHGDIWTMSASGGNARRITTGAADDQWPRWSPDGRTIAFQSNRSKNSDIWLMNADGTNLRQLTKHTKDDFFHNWSPDGTRLVFCSERSGNRDIWTINVKTGETKQLTKHPQGDDDPSWSPDGNQIAFDSAREGSQAVFVMNADGSNVRRVTRGSGFLQVPSWSPNGQFLVYEAFNPAGGRSGGLYVISAGGGAAMQISRNGATACWSPRGDYIYFTAGPNDRQEIFRVPAPTSIENREKVPFMGTVERDTKKELAQLFEEAWSRLRDGFYDAKMHGVDWNAMKKKYRQMAIDAEIKSEFHNVMRQMIAELNASHLGIGGGTRPSNAVPASTSATGYLGAELTEIAVDGGGRKILSLTKGGPADQAGLRVGDIVTRIGSKKLGASTDVDQLLAGKSGQEIDIRYRPIAEDGHGDERTARGVKPINAGQMRQMRYAQWIKRNVRMVRSSSKGRLAYIHLNAMNQQNLAQFQRAVGQWSQSRRIRGMVLDVRNNGGGNIHQQLMQVLTAKPFAWVKLRGAPRRVSQPSLFWDKPVVVLINENSFSDAEVFPWIFKTLKRGKVVGIPTPGGVIGTNDISLSDGTRFRIPRVGYYGIDGTNLEGHGVKPDVFVEETPEDRRAGRDPQLKKAIEIVMGEVNGKQPAATKPANTKPKTDAPKTNPTSTPTPKKPDTGNRKAGALDTLVDAKVGEWVKYKMVLPGQDQELVMKVILKEVDGDTIISETEVLEGPPIQLPLPTEWANKPLLEAIDALGTIGSHEQRTIKVKDKDVDAVTINVEYGGGQLQMTFTNAVLAWGLQKVQLGKFTIMEAVEWGREVPEGADAVPAKPDEPKQPAAPAKPATSAKPTASKPPAGPAAGEGTKVVNPLHDAKSGEWIKFRNVVQGQETIATMKVVEVTEDEVVLETSVAHGDTVIQGNQIRRPRRKEMNLRGAEVKVEETTLEVKGKTLKCLLITRKTRRGIVDRRWISTDVAVTGLVKRERAGKVVSELLDWGVK